MFQSANVSTQPLQILFGLPNGVVIIPFLIGIVMLFFCEKKIFGWIVTAIGVVIVLLTIIMTVRITFRMTSLFSYVLMFGLIAAGCGLLLKALFRKR
ncbi:MAG: hypothetical protein RR540_02035 [Oscillospiraceae bacterium]